MSCEIGDRELISCFRGRDDEIVLSDPRIDLLHDAGSHPAGVDIFYCRDESRRPEGIGPPVLILLDHLIVLIGAGELVEGGGGFYADDETQDIVAAEIVGEIYRDQFYT